MFALREDAYFLVATGMDEDVMEYSSFPGLSMGLKALW
jgi:hypothetical protein